MAIRIGMPQGLLYFQYGRVWEDFFAQLGADIVLSGSTNQAMLQAGNVLDEVCLPAKAFFGHVYSLRNEADYIFSPRIVSLERGQYMCPKVIGMPDMLRSNMTELPPLIDVEINLRNQRQSLYKAIVTVGRMFGCQPISALYAWYAAWKAQRRQLSFDWAEGGVRVAVIGHPYMIHDEQISLNLIGKLRELGLSVITPDMVTEAAIRMGCSLIKKSLFWSNSQHIAGAAIALMNAPRPVDGVIFFTCFSCGPDALVGELISQRAQQAGIPCMLLAVDEHTAEAGFITRVEAFSDMLLRRTRKCL